MKKIILLIFVLSLGGVLVAQQSTRREKAFTPVTAAEQQLDFASEKSVPEYNGGREAMHKFIYANMKYPADAREKGIEGDVLMQFTIGKDGSISRIKVLEGVSPSIDAEAVRVVQMMPNWIPAKYGVNNIVSSTSLIIGFHLSR